MNEREEFEAWHRTTNWPSDLGQHEGRYMSNIADASWQAWQARASLAASAGSEPVKRVFLVHTGEEHEGEATYTRHDDAPPPLCDSECLYTHPSPPEGMAGWKPIATAPKYTEHGVRQHLLLGYAPDEIHEDGFVSQGYWMEAEEDAPDNMGHDGGWVDVHFDFFSCGRSFGAEAYRSAGTQPTHWKPLPAPPLPASEAKGAT